MRSSRCTFAFRPRRPMSGWASAGKPRRCWCRRLPTPAPDGIVMPFAENYRYLKPLLAAGPQTALTARVLALGEAGERRQSGTVRPAAFTALTEREYALVGLMAQRLTNREIAEKLFLSEGSVKQYVNQIYSKLHIEGDQRHEAQAARGAAHAKGMTSGGRPQGRPPFLYRSKLGLTK